MQSLKDYTFEIGGHRIETKILVFAKTLGEKNADFWRRKLKTTLLFYLIFTKLNIFRENVRDFIGIIWQFAYLQIFRDCKGFQRTFWILTNKVFWRKNSQIRKNGIRHFCFNPEQPSAPAWSKGGEGWARGIKLNKKKWGSTADYAFLVQYLCLSSMSRRVKVFHS